MAITTAMATSFKQELFSGGHCFNATVTPTANSTSSTAVTAVSSMAGVAVGMPVTGTNIAANTVVAAVTGSNTLTLSIASTGTITGGTLTMAGDTFKVALIKAGFANTYSSTNVNYTDIGTDELATAAGYTQPGQALQNSSATTGGSTAFLTFGANPSWTSATFSTAGCMIYNSSVRNGSTSGTNSSGGGRCVSVHDFGGNQVVSAGTFSILLPTNNSTSAILRLQ